MATIFLIPDLDIKKEKKSELSALVERTIKTIQNNQGYYSALNFIIMAGLVADNDMDKAENYLKGIINGR